MKVVAKLATVAVACALATSSYGATSTAEQFPTGSALPRAEAKSTLYVFVQSADTRADVKLAEVEAVLASVHARPFVAVIQIGEVKAAVGKLQAARLFDKDGSEARRFHVTTTAAVVVHADGAVQHTESVAQLVAALER